MAELVVATDGSAKVGLVAKGAEARGPGGWAWVTNDGRQGSGRQPDTKSPEMELRAVLEALQALPSERLIIETDSQYVIDCLGWLPTWQRRGWRTKGGTPVKHRGLIEQIAAHQHRFSFRKVKGHTGLELNTRADALAGLAADGYDPEPGPEPAGGQPPAAAAGGALPAGPLPGQLRLVRRPGGGRQPDRAGPRGRLVLYRLRPDALEEHPDHRLAQLLGQIGGPARPVALGEGAADGQQPGAGGDDLFVAGLEAFGGPAALAGQELQEAAPLGVAELVGDLAGQGVDADRSA